MELCGVQELVQLASVADRFQITEVTSLLEEAVMGQRGGLRDCVDVERRV